MQQNIRANQTREDSAPFNQEPRKPPAMRGIGALSVMSLTLAEAKADRDGLKRTIAEHKTGCPRCGSTARGRARPSPCEEGRELAAQHRAAVVLVKGWFAPSPGQGMLA